MSIFAVNYLCREILRDHAFRAAMKADPAKALAPLDLTDDERRALIAGDVGTLYRMGVNGFLMGYLARFEVCGLNVEIYNERMRAVKVDEIGQPVGLIRQLHSQSYAAGARGSALPGHEQQQRDDADGGEDCAVIKHGACPTRSHSKPAMTLATSCKSPRSCCTSRCRWRAAAPARGLTRPPCRRCGIFPGRVHRRRRSRRSARYSASGQSRDRRSEK